MRHLIELKDGTTYKDDNPRVLESFISELEEDKINFGPSVVVSVEGEKINISTKQKAMMNTVKGLITNMMIGVTKGYAKKMKILYAHFPMTVEAKGKEIFIKNFLGEKQPRKAKINGDVKITVKGQEITLEGKNKYEVSQTAANIKIATKIRERDSRIFQDGIYIIGE